MSWAPMRVAQLKLKCGKGACVGVYVWKEE
jgi:hypothetical protein